MMAIFRSVVCAVFDMSEGLNCERRRFATNLQKKYDAPLINWANPRFYCVAACFVSFVDLAGCSIGRPPSRWTVFFANGEPDDASIRSFGLDFDNPRARPMRGFRAGLPDQSDPPNLLDFARRRIRNVWPCWRQCLRFKSVAL